MLEVQIYKKLAEFDLDVSFQVNDNILGLMGASGSGKSMTLKCIAGIETPDQGRIVLNDRVLFDSEKKINVPIQKRNVGYMFQSYALFPNMDVYENISVGLRARKVKDVDIVVRKVMKQFQISELASRYPKQLSGGQRQRVALARLMAYEPDVLLLDEPLSALDLKLRTDMQYELRALQKRLGITFIFVTHDQEEALAMSDEIFVMNKGKIVQSGTPVDIYDEPINHFVADFVGESNIVAGEMVEDNLVKFVGKTFECVDGGMRPNEPVEVVLRPEDLSLTTPENGKLVVTVDTQLFRGVHYEMNCIDADGNEWMVHSTKKAKKGSKVGLSFEPEDIHVMRFNESEEDFEARLESYED